jgi:hypothetical protein
MTNWDCAVIIAIAVADSIMAEIRMSLQENWDELDAMVASHL